MDINNDHTEDKHAWIDPKRLAQLMSEVEFEPLPHFLCPRNGEAVHKRCVSFKKHFFHRILALKAIDTYATLQ